MSPPRHAAADLRPRLVALARAGPATDAAERVLARFPAERPITLAMLTRLLDDPDPALVDDVCWVLGQLRRKAAAPALVALLRGDRPDHWWPAANALAHLNSRRALPALIALLHDKGDPLQREAAACALSFSYYPGSEATLTTVFVAVLTRADEVPRVRAQVAEGLAYLHEFGDREGAAFAQARDALLAMLRDPTPEVRFWSAFALGNLRVAEATPALAALTTDTTPVPGWWTVGEEASDALIKIQGGEPPERTPGSNAQPPAEQ